MNPLPKNNAHPWPRLVFWETTAACNLLCSHCRRTDVADEPSPDELSVREAESLIDELASWGRTILVLSGGEPLLRPDIFHLMSYADEKGLVVALATNGTLIDRDLAGRIQESGVDRVSISLDGADEPTHDAFRRLPGSFRSAMAGIQALRTEGIPVQINVTVAKHNVDQMDEMVSLAKKLGAVALHLFLLVPVGCGMEIAEEQTLQADAYEETLNWLYETERREPNLQLRATCAPHYFRVVRQRETASADRDRPSSGAPTGHPGGHPSAGGNDRERGALHAATRGCLAGSGVCFVSHTGKVYGCGYMPIEAGDLRRNSLAEIWQTSGLFAELRDTGRLEGKCGRCGFSRVCGGCRARAYGSTGDYLAEEPFCAYLPGGRSDPLSAVSEYQGEVQT
ncbi:MAG TPA: radical SAM protein [Thermoleophilia bacterium]|nr:radical SAM protein [Thermoleophilia bacterium]